MQTVTNTTLVRKRVRLAGGLHLAALAIFALGLVVSFRPEVWFYSYIAIIVGLVLYQVAQTNLRRYGPRHRRELELARNLKGLDNRYTLVAFPDPSLPDYLIVGPPGVQVLVTRPHKGSVACRADRWSLARGGLFQRLRAPLGNPTTEAWAGIETVKRRLPTALEGAEDIPVGAVVVFTHPEAHLRIDGCSWPVTTIKELRHYLRRIKGNLNQAQTARIRQALAPFSTPGTR